MDNVSVDNAIEPSMFILTGEAASLLQMLLPNRHVITQVKKTAKKSLGQTAHDFQDDGPRQKRQSRLNLERRNLNEDFN